MRLRDNAVSVSSIMKAVVDEGQGSAFENLDYFYSDNATSLVVNLTEMAEVCPYMSDDDRELLQGWMDGVAYETARRRSEQII